MRIDFPKCNLSPVCGLICPAVLVWLVASGGTAEAADETPALTTIEITDSAAPP